MCEYTFMPEVVASACIFMWSTHRSMRIETGSEPSRYWKNMVLGQAQCPKGLKKGRKNLSDNKSLIVPNKISQPLFILMLTLCFCNERTCCQLFCKKDDIDHAFKMWLDSFPVNVFHVLKVKIEEISPNGCISESEVITWNESRNLRLDVEISAFKSDTGKEALIPHFKTRVETKGNIGQTVYSNVILRTNNVPIPESGKYIIRFSIDGTTKEIPFLVRDMNVPQTK